MGSIQREPRAVSAARDVAVTVSVIDLLGEDIDLTPGRHAWPPREAPISRARAWQPGTNTWQQARRTLPTAAQLPKSDIRGDGPIRDVSLDELAQRGAIYIRRAAPRAAEALGIQPAR